MCGPGQSNAVGTDSPTTNAQYGGHSTAEMNSPMVDRNGNYVLVVTPDVGQTAGAYGSWDFGTYTLFNGGTTNNGGSTTNVFPKGALWTPGVAAIGASGTNISPNPNVANWSTVGAMDMAIVADGGLTSAIYNVTPIGGGTTGPTRGLRAPLFADIVGSQSGSVSICYDFAAHYAVSVVAPSRRVVVVAAAVGGTRMHCTVQGCWMWNDGAPSGLLHRLINAVNAILASTPSIGSAHRIVANLVQQGESDAIYGTGDQWPRDWLAVVHALRALWGNVSTLVAPFVSGYTEYAPSNAQAASYCTLTRAILGLPLSVAGSSAADVAWTRVVSTLGLQGSGGNSAAYGPTLHWGARASRRLAARYYNAFCALTGMCSDDPSGLDQATLQPPSGAAYSGGVPSFSSQAVSWRTTSNAWAYAINATRGNVTVAVLVTELAPAAGVAQLPYSTTQYTSGVSAVVIAGVTYTLLGVAPTFTPPSATLPEAAQLAYIVRTADVIAAPIGVLLPGGGGDAWTFSVRSVAYDPNAGTYAQSAAVVVA